MAQGQPPKYMTVPDKIELTSTSVPGGYDQFGGDNAQRYNMKVINVLVSSWHYQRIQLGMNKTRSCLNSPVGKWSVTYLWIQ